MTFTTVFFDLDDTLYPSHCGLWQLIRERMGLYMHERLGLSKEDIPALRHHYYTTYGTTLRGLQQHHKVDVDEYLAYVHDIPLRDYIGPAPELKSLIASMPQRRWIFTNADANHARRVLEVLGLGDCFEGIIDICALSFSCKPEPQAYLRALELAGGPSPEECVLLDDALANLAPARQMGFTTVLIGENGKENLAATYTSPSVLELPRILPGLWATVEK